MLHTRQGLLPSRTAGGRTDGRRSPSYDGRSIDTTSSSTTTPDCSLEKRTEKSTSPQQAAAVRQLLEFMSAADAGDPTAVTLFADLNTHQQLFNAAAESDEMVMEEDTTRGMWSEDGYPLSVCVQGDDYYFQLLEDDLRKVFGRYGEVRLIEVTSPDRDVAHVYYEQLTDAQNAVQDLNDKILNGVHGALHVVWGLHHTPRAFPNTDRPLKSSRDHHYARGSQAAERTQGRHDGVSEVDPCSGRSLEDTEAAISRLLSEIRDVASPLKGNKAHLLGSSGSPSGAASGPLRSDAWRAHSPNRQYGERRAGWSSSAEEHFYDDAGHYLGDAWKGGTARTSPAAAPPPALVARGSATGAPSTGGPVRKFTCRFDIGIENDKEFQVARRIIGNKGANMKRIVGLSNAKLRLRGQGSGYLEGAVRQESPDPLHLCISCINRDGYYYHNYSRDR
ncbi:hypothetical protein FOZ62_002624, partial [Perkinsus olseni]